MSRSPLSAALFLALLLLSFLFPTKSLAQCDWLPGDGYRGTNNSIVHTTVWDPDGPGPTAAQLVAIGNFTIAGETRAYHIAAWDGARWRPLGGGLQNTPTAVAVSQNTLYAATSRPGNTFAILRWDDPAWTTIGSGPGYIYAMTEYRGDLIVSGYFTTINDTLVQSIARWDGAAWQPLGLGLNAGAGGVALCPDSDTLYVGGRIATAGRQIVNNIAAWDGAEWSALGDGITLSENSFGVSALARFHDHLFAAVAYDTSSVWSWDGLGWSDISIHTLYFNPSCFAILGDNLYLADGGGASPPRPGLFRFHNLGWDLIDPSPDGVASLSVFNDHLVAAGGFTSIGAAQFGYIAESDGTTWTALPSAGWVTGDPTDSVYSATTDGPDLVVGGNFLGIGAIDAHGLARTDGTAWRPMDAGDPPTSTFYESGPVVLTRLGPDLAAITGDYFGGFYLWNGQEWRESTRVPYLHLGTYVYAGVEYRAQLILGGAMGDPYGYSSIGPFYILSFDRGVWKTLEPGRPLDPNNRVRALTVFENDLIAGGDFTAVGERRAAHIARWNGDDWSPLGPGIPTAVRALLVYRGELIAASTNDVRRWTGSSWEPFGPYGVRAMITFNGDLIAAGAFSNAPGVPATNIAAWNGQTWRPLGTGLNGQVLALTIHNNDLIAVGGFTRAGRYPSAFVARWSCSTCYPNCDASVTPPYLNINDLVCFISRFASGDDYANCDASTTPPVLTIADFACFLSRFAEGCP